METSNGSTRGEASVRADPAHARAILDAALDAVITIDHEGLVLEFNRAAEEIFGYRREDVLGLELAALIVPPAARDAHRRALERWTATGPEPGAGGLLGRRIEVQAVRADGSELAVELAISRVEVPGPPLFTACLRDISERRQAEERLREAELRYRTLVEQLPLAVYVDRADAISSNVYTSPQIEAMLGFTADEWMADPTLFVERLHRDDRERVLAAHRRTYATGEPLCLEYRLYTRDGRVVWVHDEAILLARVGDDAPLLQGYLLDITARKEAEEQLRYQAIHDPVTGLPNRALFTNRVEHALVVRGDDESGVSVLFIDLDDFKAVNDSLGHVAGDELLRAVGARLRDALPPSLTVARMGGDEFAILVESHHGAPTPSVVAERIEEALRSPFEIQGHEVFVTASVGIGTGADADELLRSSDVAMYGAKAGGKAQYAVYVPRADAGSGERFQLLGDLRRASVEDAFVLRYQPLLDLRTGRVLGAEALLRWQHPTRGLLAPSEFIHLAEETGRIAEIGEWVLLEACRQTAAWRRMLPEAPVEVSVNVSPRQVQRPGLVDSVSNALRASGLAPHHLTVEITESVVAGRRDEMTAILDEVTGLGVVLALDDFGTGYSSLSLLRDLPVQILKIDRSFVQRIGPDGDQVPFVRAICELAHALEVTVVAEGIEEEGQVTALRRLGCGVGQGFYFATPLPPGEFLAFARGHRGRSAA